MPDTIVDAEVIREAVQMACRAPSLHNSQPWRWVADTGRLHLHLDRDRVMQSADRGGREALISCGAALDHLRVALAATGWRITVDRFPNPNDPTHLAAVDLAPMEFVTDAHRRLADAIPLRRTDRLPLGAPPEWERQEALLRVRIDGGLSFDVLGDDARHQLAEASSLTEALRLYDSPYHAELSWWTAPIETEEGIPHSSLVSASESERVDVGRSFPVTGHSQRRAALGEDHAKVVVLSTDGDTRDAAVRSGEALSRILLDCTAAGLASCTVTHVTELAVGRDIITALIGRDTFPQLLIRIGVAPALEKVPVPTPRRPLDDVLTFTR